MNEIYKKYQEVEKLNKQLEETKQKIIENAIKTQKEITKVKKIGPLTGLSEDAQALLANTYHTEKHEESSLNKQLKTTLTELTYKDKKLTQDIYDIKLVLAGIFQKFVLKHKSTYPETSIYERLGLKEGKDFILSYDECMNDEYLYGFLHLFDDVLIYESVILPDKIKRIKYGEIEKIIKSEKIGEDNGIVIWMKDNTKLGLFGLENRDYTLDKCLTLCALEQVEEKEGYESENEK